MDFRRELAQVINRHGLDNRYQTPDFVLAFFIESCLEAFGHGTVKRDSWFGFDPEIKYNGKEA